MLHTFIDSKRKEERDINHHGVMRQVGSGKSHELQKDVLVTVLKIVHNVETIIINIFLVCSQKIYPCGWRKGNWKNDV